MPVQFIISEGAMKTSVNGQLVDDKEYRAVYDGKDGDGTSFSKKNDDYKDNNKWSV